MSWRPDPEIDELFPDPRDRRLAQALRTVHAPDVSPDPAFRSQLRRQLMEEAWTGAQPRLGWWRRLWSPPRVAWAMAAVGALLIAVVVYSTSGGSGDRTVLIHANVDLTQPVAAVQPVELTFSQPMNRQSVESALQIQPATTVQYQWTSDTQVRIIPVSGAFAPNTQYTVSLRPNVAQTQVGHPVPASTTAVFTVAPTPAPAPPTPTASPTPALAVRVLGSASDVRPQWNYQGRIVAVGPNGELETFPVDGGAPEVLVPAGVTGFALSPDTSKQEIAYVRGGQVFTYAARPAPASPAAAGAIAVAFNGQGQVVYASGAAVTTGPGHELKLRSAAVNAWFSPGGDRLLYQSADRSLHEVDLATGQETAWPAGAVTFLAWSPDGSRVLYASGEGVFTAGPDGLSPTRLAVLTGATAAAWPASGRLLIEAGGVLHSVALDGSDDRILGTADAAALAVSPTGAIALTGGGHLGLAQSPGAAGLTVEAAAPAVAAFEKARASGDQAAAAAVVASGARTLAPPATGIQRWFAVAAFSASDGVHESVRIVLGRAGKDTSQLDEKLLVVAGPDGKPLIASAVDSPARQYGAGPEVLAVGLAPSRITVEFDSDLTGPSVAGALRVTDASGRPVAVTATISGRTVTLTPAAPLDPGVYHLAVGTSVLDANGRPAVAEFDLDLPLAG